MSDAFIKKVSIESLAEASALGRMDESSEGLRDAELEYIRAWREKKEHNGGEPKNLTGLALSGGGIRSATFSLGVLQALAKKGLLEKMDYLSTVSGGGYIGSSLTWLTSDPARRRYGVKFGVGRKDFPFGTKGPNAPSGVSNGESSSPTEMERNQTRMLKFLRQHGNYLTPGKGIGLTSLIAIVLRGMLLNLLVWLPIMAVAMLSLLLLSARWSVQETVSAFLSELATISALLPRLEITKGGPTFLFDMSLLGSLVLAAFFGLSCIGYSIATWFAAGWAAKHRYSLRRIFETWAGRLLWVIGILLVFGSLPVVSEQLRQWFVGFAGPGAIVSGLASGIWAYLKSRNKDAGKVPLGLIVSVASVLLVYGVLLMSYRAGDWAHGILFNSDPSAWIWGGMMAPVIVAVVTGFLVNLNYISIHRYYRDRLMETFMPDIDKALEGETGAAKGADGTRLHDVSGKNAPRGPYHIVNTNVVLVDSKVRTRRIRGGDNFILSPLYCGSNATGWQSAEDFMRGQMTLATAMAISGAAANPNAGVGGVGLTRNPFVSVLMALLNLRLGYWVRNPTPHRPRRLRANHIHPGLYEILTVGYRETRWFLQLSDGGHFENLGLYELIRRRLKLIILCDGTADPNFSFGNFQTALRRISADFGARIEFGDRDKPDDDTNKLKRLTPQDNHVAGYPKGVKLADQGHIVGDITYADGTTGTLIFLKTTLIPGLRVELMGYRGANPDFPDQTTADQFFDEEQFEAYRELGYTIAKKMIEDIEANSDYDNKEELRDFIPNNQ